MEHFEVSGKSVAGPRMAVIEDQNAYGCTLFLGQQLRASRAAELDGHEAYVDGKELYFVPERRVKPNFKELARRTGVPQQKLEEAYGTIDTYKPNRGVLQRIMFSRQQDFMNGSQLYLMDLGDLLPSLDANTRSVCDVMWLYSIMSRHSADTEVVTRLLKPS